MNHLCQFEHFACGRDDMDKVVDCGGSRRTGQDVCGASWTAYRTKLDLEVAYEEHSLVCGDHGS